MMKTQEHYLGEGTVHGNVGICYQTILTAAPEEEIGEQSTPDQSETHV